MKSFSPRYILDLCRRILFLAFFAQVFTLNALGDTEVIVDGIKYNLVSEARTATVIANNYSGDVVIPSSFETDGVEYIVTRIGEYAFQSCNELTSITIPETIISIGDGVFSGCTSLEAVNITDLAAWCGISFVTGLDYNGSNPLQYAHHLFIDGEEIKDLVIPSNVTRIGGRAFDGCSSLKSVTIPNSVTSIGRDAFYGCTSLEAVNIFDLDTWCNISFFNRLSNPLYHANHLYLNGQEIKDLIIPNGVTNISKRAFYYCSSLTSVTIPESVISIGEEAFYGCKFIDSVNIIDLAAWCSISFGENSTPLHYANHLCLNGQEIKDLVIPNNITSIGDDSFRDCPGLMSITIPHSVTSIGNRAFAGCSNLTSVTIPNSVTSIGRYAFSDCTGLTSVTLPNGITTIEDGLFSWCSSLTSITIPNGVNRIGYQSFFECTSLTSVMIPKSVTTIGSEAFLRCNSIKSVYCLANQVPNTWSSFDNNLETATLYVPRSSIDEYKSLTPWSEFGNILTIAFDFEKDGIYYKINSDETSVTVTNMGHSNSYSGLVEIPSEVMCDEKNYNVTAIGEYAFSRCTDLTSITISNSVTTIADYAFYESQNIKSVTIGRGVISIGYDAFYNCKSLTSVNIVDLAAWCNISFANSSPLEYAHHLYLDGQEIKDLVIPNSVTSLGNHVFGSCTGLTSVIIPNSVTSIGSGAFSFCSGITSITIPESIVNIGNSAFVGCTGLTSITIPNNLTTIENWAFSGCTGLTSVTIPNSVTSIGYGSFFGCTGIKSVFISNNVTNIRERAFEGCDGLTKAEFTSIESLCKISFSNAYANPLSYAKHLYVNGQEVTELVIPQSITSIGLGTFYNCVGLTAVTIPTSVTSIGKEAFANCSGLTSITIPKSAANIGDSAFHGCTGLNTIYSDATTPPSLSSNSFDVEGSTPTLYVLQGCKEVYANAQYWNRFNIIEHAYVESIEIDVPQYDIIVGESKSINVTILPITATHQALYWKIDNPDIATIDNGVVTGIKTGTTVITATTRDGTNLSASCTVNVTNPVIALTLDRISAELMVGQQMTLQATCTPSNADNINVSWSSNNEDIASVNNGVVIAKGLGDAIITARSVNGIEATCKITVVPTPVTSLSLNTTSVDLVKDATYQLTCGITPEDATNKGLVWTSLNSGVASVNESGLVTAMSTGTTTIIVSSASNSEITASCIINVTTPVTSIKLDHEALELLVDDEVQLIATCMPSDADNARVVWSTTNGEISIVSQDGYITAKNEGDALITVTTTDGTNLSASCQIHVKRHKQMISWSQETMTCQEGGEMIVLEANSNSGLPISFNSSEPKIVSIFDLGDIVYANPIKEGKTVISAYQQGNYKYEPAEAKREIEVIGKPMGGSRTLVAYYSQSALMDGIVAELTNQIASSYTQVYTQKIEPSNARIDMANHDTAIRDSVMNVIFLYPDDAVSYPEIKPLNVAVGDYDDIILVYPIWNMSMAAPMQTFCFQNRDILESKSVAYIEYDLFDEAGTSSNAQVLRLCPSNIADKKDLIKEWLDKSVATGILQFRHDKKESRDGIYDLQGRKLHEVPSHGIFMIEGKKIAK